MTEEDKLVTQQNEGVAARRALDEVGSAFEEVKRELTGAWLATAPRDDEGREKLWVATTILTRVEALLKNKVNNGTVAAKELDRIRRSGKPNTLADRYFNH